MKRCFSLLTAVLALSGTAPAFASGWDDTIATDRPDSAESSRTVGRYRLQIEQGYDIATVKSGGIRTSTFTTPTKIRFGITDDLEIHVEAPGLVYEFGDRPGGNLSRAGFSNLDLGFKGHFLDNDGAVPSIGLLVAFTVPTATGDFEGTHLFRPTLAFDWDLPAAFGLAVNIGVNAALDRGSEPANVFRWAVSLGRSWAPLSDRVGTFVETFGEVNFDSGAVLIYLDGGFTFLITPDFQLDLNVRGGVHGDTPDVGGGIGWALRI